MNITLSQMILSQKFVVGVEARYPLHDTVELVLNWDKWTIANIDDLRKKLKLSKSITMYVELDELRELADFFSYTYKRLKSDFVNPLELMPTQEIHEPDLL